MNIQNSISKKILNFYFNLKNDLKLENSITTIFPFQGKEAQRVMSIFYNKYYSDKKERVIIFSINPGRFGAGVTGIPFTDPKILDKYCDIKNNFKKRDDLSTSFIFDVIYEYGGVEKFYKKFYTAGVSPVGFLKEDKNYNYYDDTTLLNDTKEFIVDSIKKQMNFFPNNRNIICIGLGKNLKFLESINKEFNLFENIYPLPHPRWIMQYKLKDKDRYIKEYVDTLKKF